MKCHRSVALACFSVVAASIAAGAVDFDKGASRSPKDSWQETLGASQFRHALDRISRAPLLRVATRVSIVLESSRETGVSLRAILAALKKYDFEALRVERIRDNAFIVYGAMPYPNIPKARRQGIPGVKGIDAAVPA